MQHIRPPCPSLSPRVGPKFMSTESLMLSNHFILCHPLLILPSIFPSIRVFSNELALHIKWPKYWNFSFSISLSNEYSGLISFRIDWFDFLAVQETLKSLFQHHDWKASVLQCSAFFMTRKKKKLRPREGLGPTQGFIGLPWWYSGWESASQCRGSVPGRGGFHIPRSN